MGERSIDLPAEGSGSGLEKPLFTDSQLEEFLSYERFETEEIASIPRTGLGEEERTEAVREARLRAKFNHRVFYDNFLSQVFPDADDGLCRLVFFCNENFHEGNPVEISSIKFWRDEGTGLMYLSDGMALTPFYKETFLLQDKPMKMTIRRARSMGFDFGPEGHIRVHSTFACTCQLRVEIRTERLNNFFLVILNSGQKNGLIHERELRFSLKSLSLLIGSR